MSLSALRKIFEAYVSFPGGKQRNKEGLDSFRFSKLCRECRFYDASMPPPEFDIIYARIKEKKGKDINFQQFRAALSLIAERKGVELASIETQVVSMGGPLQMKNSPSPTTGQNRTQNPGQGKTHKKIAEEDWGLRGEFAAFAGTVVERTYVEDPEMKHSGHWGEKVETSIYDLSLSQLCAEIERKYRMSQPGGLKMSPRDSLPAVDGLSPRTVDILKNQTPNLPEILGGRTKPALAGGFGSKPRSESLHTQMTRQKALQHHQPLPPQGKPSSRPSPKLSVNTKEPKIGDEDEDENGGDTDSEQLPENRPRGRSSSLMNHPTTPITPMTPGPLRSAGSAFDLGRTPIEGTPESKEDAQLAEVMVKEVADQELRKQLNSDLKMPQRPSASNLSLGSGNGRCRQHTKKEFEWMCSWASSKLELLRSLKTELQINAELMSDMENQWAISQETGSAIDTGAVDFGEVDDQGLEEWLELLEETPEQSPSDIDLLMQKMGMCYRTVMQKAYGTNIDLGHYMGRIWNILVTLFDGCMMQYEAAFAQVSESYKKTIQTLVEKVEKSEKAEKEAIAAKSEALESVVKLEMEQTDLKALHEKEIDRYKDRAFNLLNTIEIQSRGLSRGVSMLGGTELQEAIEPGQTSKLNEDKLAWSRHLDSLTKLTQDFVDELENSNHHLDLTFDKSPEATDVTDTEVEVPQKKPKLAKRTMSIIAMTPTTPQSIVFDNDLPEIQNSHSPTSEQLVKPWENWKLPLEIEQSLQDFRGVPKRLMEPLSLREMGILMSRLYHEKVTSNHLEDQLEQGVYVDFGTFLCDYAMKVKGLKQQAQLYLLQIVNSIRTYSQTTLRVSMLGDFSGLGERWLPAEALDIFLAMVEELERSAVDVHSGADVFLPFNDELKLLVPKLTLITCLNRVLAGYQNDILARVLTRLNELKYEEKKHKQHLYFDELMDVCMDVWLEDYSLATQKIMDKYKNSKFAEFSRKDESESESSFSMSQSQTSRGKPAPLQIPEENDEGGERFKLFCDLILDIDDTINEKWIFEMFVELINLEEADTEEEAFLKVIQKHDLIPKPLKVKKVSKPKRRRGSIVKKKGSRPNSPSPHSSRSPSPMPSPIVESPMQGVFLEVNERLPPEE